MKKFVLILFLAFASSVSGQKAGGHYILFEQDKSSSCQFTVNRESQKKINHKYTQKRHRKVNVTRFILCRNVFVFEFKTNHFEIIDAAGLSKLTPVTLDEIFTKEQEAEYKKNINELFPKLYVIEAHDDGQYGKYEVVWEKIQ